MGYAELFNSIKDLLGNKRYEDTKTRLLELGDRPISLNNILLTAIKGVLKENKELEEENYKLKKDLDYSRARTNDILVRLASYGLNENLDNVLEED